MKISLQDSHEIILNTLPQFIFIVTESGTYIEAFGNDSFTTTPGFDNKKLIGYSIHDLFDEQRAKNFSVLISRAISTGTEQLVKYGFTRGETFPIVGFPEVRSDVWYEGVIRPLDIEYKGEKTILWSVKNITQQISLENELRYLSETDELTGVTNRRSLMKMMQFSFEQAKTTHQVGCLLLLDVDHFKHVNDSYGHQVGDNVLKHLSQVCSTHLREKDIFCRFGGEEFAVLLPNTDEELGFYIAERLRLAIETTPCKIGMSEVSVTASIGVSAFKPNDLSEDMVVGRSDKALYHSKSRGRNRTTVFSTSIQS
ncbi:sensor domain-containing diguanylate cyclase [Vibrio sp. M260118]|uniref:sensor domain-containing diguanylate cyclase n=1 Tax=Vibrio sp. M260118 TaxID=3020896 RepID=UPI002F42611B